MNSLRILFYGTPDFAVETLKILVQNSFIPIGVVTAVDKPAGRGYELQESAVKKYAKEHNIPIFQPANLKSEEFFQQLKTLNPNIQIVVAFRMMPEKVWSFPELGTFNLHGSLLPNYRGAAPIHWAVINGEKQTGVTTFFLKHEIDTGDIILQDEIDISEQETTGDIHDRLMHVGAYLVLKTLRKIEQGDISTIPQNKLGVHDLKIAPKLTKENTKVDWKSSVYEVYNFIRGLNPYPIAWTTLSNNSDQYMVKIFSSEKEYKAHAFEFGRIFTDSKTYMKVTVKDGFIHVKELQLQGKKRMKMDEFLRGFKFETNAKFM